MLTHEQIVPLFIADSVDAKRWRYSLDKTFVASGYEYATNGRYVVRWATTSPDTTHPHPPVDDLFATRETCTLAVFACQPVPKLVQVPSLLCNTCEGVGSIYNNETEIRCPACDGVGVTNDFAQELALPAAKIHGWSGNQDYLNVLLAMGINTVLVGTDHRRVRFNSEKYEGVLMGVKDGKGVVMPNVRVRRLLREYGVRCE